MICEFPAAMLFSPLPLVRVTKGNFFESHPIDRSRTGNVEMSGNDDVGTEPLMPVFGIACAAPDHEPWYARQDGEFLFEREVSDQNGWVRNFSERLFETLLAMSTAGRAPLADAGVGIGVKEDLVHASSFRFLGPVDRLVDRNVIWTKTVVVE